MHLFRKLVTSAMPLLAPVFTLVALTGPAATPKTVAPAVVFENTIAPYVYTDAGEAGDTVQLAGSERLITQISIGVVCNGLRPVNTDDFQMRLWTADGPNGTAGRLLWQSDYLMNVPLAGPVQLLTFSVPGIEVPDTLIWSVNHTGSDVFFQWSNPVTIGSSPNYAWTYLTQKLPPYFGTPANFMARIEAVPEPGAGLILIFGIGALLGRFVRSPKKFVRHRHALLPILRSAITALRV